MWKSLVVFIAIIGITMAALAIGPLPSKPEKFQNVEGCYIEDNDVVIPFNQATASNKSCKEIWCSRSQLTYVTCGAVLVSPPCKVVTDSKKHYPDCCPKIVCP